MSWDKEMEEYDGVFINQTINAVLFLPAGCDEGDEVWLPKSQIDFMEDDYERGDDITISVPNWLAREKELI